MSKPGARRRDGDCMLCATGHVHASKPYPPTWLSAPSAALIVKGCHSGEARQSGLGFGFWQGSCGAAFAL